MSGHFREGRELLAAALERLPRNRRRPGRRLSSERGCSPLRRMIMGSREGCRRMVSPTRAPGSARIEVTALSLLSSYEAFGWDEQIRLGEEAIALARTSGDRWLLGLVTGNHGVLMARFGEIEKAIELRMRHIAYAAGLATSRSPRCGSQTLRGTPWRAGTPPRLAAGWTSRSSRRLIDDTRGIGQALDTFGWAELLEGDSITRSRASRRRRRSHGGSGRGGSAPKQSGVSPKSQPQAGTPTARRALRGPRSCSVGPPDRPGRQDPVQSSPRPPPRSP